MALVPDRGERRAALTDPGFTGRSVYSGGVAALRALDLVGKAVSRTAPLGLRVLGGVQRAWRGVSEAVVGADFEQRMQVVRDAYPQGDPFGLELRAVVAQARSAAALHRLYFRTEVSGLEHVGEGPALVVANHSGQLPFDAAIVAATLLLDLPTPRLLRVAVDPAWSRYRFVLSLLGKWGCVPTDPGSIRSLLDRGEVVLVFPEGLKGLAKPITRRYQLEAFDPRFVSAAALAGASLVPLAIVGAEEQYLGLGSAERLASVLGLPALPVVPQWLLPGGQFPLPTRYRLRFGEALNFSRGAIDDGERSHRAWLVRQSVADLLRTSLAERRRVFW